MFFLFYFSWIPLMTSSDSLSDLLKGTIISSTFCVLLNVQLFSRELSVATSMSNGMSSRTLDQAHLKSLKFLLWWCITKKNVCKETFFKPLSVNLTKWSNTLKQFTQTTVWVCLTILWGWRLRKPYFDFRLNEM